MISQIILLFLLLQAKHFIADFILQTNWQAFNKHNVFHPGGYVHAGITAVATYLVFFVWFLLSGYHFSDHFYHTVLSLVIMEFLIHYVIDWSKMNFNKCMCWGPTTHKEFWWLLGLDQFLHQLCYIGMVYAIFLL